MTFKTIHVSHKKLQKIINALQNNITLDEEGKFTKKDDEICKVASVYFLGHEKADLYEIKIPEYIIKFVEDLTNIKLC